MMGYKATQLTSQLAVLWYLLVSLAAALATGSLSFSVAQVSDRNIGMPNHHGDTLGGSLTEPCEHPLLPPTPRCLATVVPLDFLYVQADSLKRNFATGTGTQLSLLHCSSSPQDTGCKILGQVKGDD